MRVRIAGLLVQEPDFLLLDEPTNHLDYSARLFVYELIRSWKKGLVVVSHDRTLLSFVDQIAELGAQGLRFYGGDFQFYKHQRAAEKEAAEQSLATAKLKLKKAQTTARRTVERQQKRSASGHKHAAKTGISLMFAGNMKRKAENSASKLQGRHQKKIEDASRALQLAREGSPPDNHIIVDLEQPTVPAGKRMVELSKVNYRYAGAERFLWSTALDITITGAERVCLDGPNGSGKSTLIDLICGRKTPSAGVAKVATQRIGFIDQSVDLLDPALSVLDNLKQAAQARPEHELRILLGRFLFQKDAVLKTTSVLSGGERVRGALACLLGADQAPEILILDEPTNNLDLASVEAVASALGNYRGTLIVVSHDREFLEEIGVQRRIELAKA
jgi:ATPase subunit of ABC transporter with duplicated ATPase domains